MDNLDYVEETLTMAQFAKKYLGLVEFDIPESIDISDEGFEILTLDSSGNEVYKPITRFVVKEPVTEFYTNGSVRGTAEHRVIENNTEIELKNHPQFTKVIGDMSVVDLEVADEHTYISNNMLHHNSTSGGWYSLAA